MKKIIVAILSVMLLAAFMTKNENKMEKKSIYKSDKYKQEFMRLYEEKLASLNVSYTDHYIKTDAGTTHVLEMGDPTKPAVVVLHGVTANAPIALEPLKGLLNEYHVYGVDIVGQPNKSDENRLPLKDDSYGKWLVQVLDELKLDSAAFIGVSYGGFILQRLIAYAPARVSKTIFLVPGGFTNGNMLQAIKRVVKPMRKYMKTGSEEAFLQFYDAFYSERDSFFLEYQKLALDGINMDTRRPPLIKKKEAQRYTNPVYILGADDDIFFPGPKAIKKCEVYFPNFKEGIIMKDCRHVPTVGSYDYIEVIVRRWLSE